MQREFEIRSLSRRLSLGPGERWAACASLCYALTNTLLRASIKPDQAPDPVIAAILRLLPVTALAWLLTFIANRTGDFRPGSARFAGWRAVLAVLLAGLSSYFAGNTAYQLALNHGGVGVTVPVAQSASLWGGILMGSLFLGEQHAPQVAYGGLVVMAGLVLLITARSSGTLLNWTAALPLAAIAGASYALSNILMRSAFQRGMGQFPGLALNALSGLSVLLMAAWLRLGFDIFSRTTPDTIVALLSAGVFNAGALFSLSRALTLTTAGRVNTINTATIALSTLLAAILFGEPLTMPIGLGILLTIGGILLVQRHLASARA